MTNVYSDARTVQCVGCGVWCSDADSLREHQAYAHPPTTVHTESQTRTRVKLTQNSKALNWEISIEGSDEAEVRERVIRMRAWCEAQVNPEPICPECLCIIPVHLAECTLNPHNESGETNAAEELSLIHI